MKKNRRCSLPFAAKLGIFLFNLGVSLTTTTMLPVKAAERIYLSFGPLEFSLSVSGLEEYAKEGTISTELASYAKYLTPEQLEQLRTILTTRADLTPLALSQFFYSYQGELILQQIGEVIQTKARQPGFYAIRSALILAAADEAEGLTPLNVLKKFPTQGILIRSDRGFEIIDQLSSIIQDTNLAIAKIESQSQAEVSPERLESFATLPDLRQTGTVTYNKQTLVLNDRPRGRTFPTDLYLPQQSQPSFLVVISHGLGSSRETFEYLAKHLASYGFAVAVLEHPGSNSQQLQQLASGLANEVTPARELIDRPLDIKYLLDVLESSYSQQVRTDRVGILGQSYGGYTALAITGATFNFEKLRDVCPPLNSLNLSLLIQCQADTLPELDYNLQDERIKAAIAINPLTSTIFGENELSKIQIPLMLVTSSSDTVAPALAEQIIPFTWLNNPEKYLVLLKGGTHFSALGSSSEEGVPVPEQAIGPDPQVAQEYVQALSLAFFATYIGDRAEYQVYLSPAYAQFLSQDLIPLSLVENLDLENLGE
ncbi:MAG: alpha/beta hydrolase [Oscillatoria sp. PMC 1068.18]|nr:alpha/beta hydrolase [Oscillatoria sp. PMC 1076.18]MEC4991818.1 alpha/beta hydrolase [Oscillatoria sp. PMC 1068.18]